STDSPSARSRSPRRSGSPAQVESRSPNGAVPRVAPTRWSGASEARFDASAERSPTPPQRGVSAPTHARPPQKGEPPLQQEHQQPAQESHAQASPRQQTGAQGKWAQEPKGRGNSQEPKGKGTPQESKHGHRPDPEQDRADAHDGRQDHRNN